VFEKPGFRTAASSRPVPVFPVNDDISRRRVLRTGPAALAGSVGLTAVGSAAASNGESENATQFGRVRATGVLRRPDVVRVLEGRPDPEDPIRVSTTARSRS
jgi:hypothetical protein